MPDTRGLSSSHPGALDSPVSVSFSPPYSVLFLTSGIFPFSSLFSPIGHHFVKISLLLSEIIPPLDHPSLTTEFSKMSTTVPLIPRVPSCSVLAPFWPVISSGRHPASLTEVALESAVRSGGRVPLFQVCSCPIHCPGFLQAPFPAFCFCRSLSLVLETLRSSDLESIRG